MSDQLDRLARKFADLRDHVAALLPDAPEFTLSPPLGDDEVAAIEAELGVRLPDGYRGFVTRIGVAGAGPDYGLVARDGWAMPAEMVQVTSTITTTSGETFSAGTGPRAPLARAPETARPFLMPPHWRPVDDAGVLVPPPLPPDAHLYDGCIQLGEIGCGYFNFLIINGAHAGEVWCDYSAGDGSISPIAPFLDWYEAWVDEWMVAALGSKVREALEADAPSPHDELVRRWTGAFAKSSLIAQAELQLYLGDRDGALAQIATLDGQAGPQLDALDRWLHRAAATAAAASPPDVEPALACPSWRIRRTLAANPVAPASALTRLLDDERVEVRLAALQNPSCPPAALDHAASAAEARWDGVAPPIELDLIARHPGTPSGTLERLAALPWRRREQPLATAVVRAVANNPRSPAELLVRISDSSAAWVRHAVARHPATPAPVIAALASDPHWAVRAAIALRPDAAAHLERLAADPQIKVRVNVAANPAASPALLRRLATEDDYQLAYPLAGNPSLPDDALDVVSDHPSEPIRNGVRPGPHFVWAELPLLALIGDRGQVGNPGFPPSLLDAAIAHSDTLWGNNAAGSPWLDAAQLEALSRHPYSYARATTAGHPDASVEVRTRLAHDPQPMTVRAASLTVALDEATLERLAAEDNEELRWAAADNPGASAALLARLATDPHEYVRRAVAGNPRTAAEVALALTADANPGVRAAAVRRADIPAARVAELEADADAKVARSARWERKRRALR